MKPNMIPTIIPTSFENKRAAVKIHFMVGITLGLR